MNTIHIITPKQIGAMEAQLSKWGESLDTLEAPNPNEELKAKYHNRLLELESKVHLVRAQLKDSRAAAMRRNNTARNWRAFKV